MRPTPLVLPLVLLALLACGDKDADTGELSAEERGCKEYCTELEVQCDGSDTDGWSSWDGCYTDCLDSEEIPSNYRIRCVEDAADCAAALECTQEPT